MIAAAMDPTFATLNGIPSVDMPTNLRAAIASGKQITALLREILALRSRPGKLALQEYFYYRLWERHLSSATKREFIGKQAQHLMHVAAGTREWFATAADKILFQSIMDGLSFPTPELLAITQAGRYLAACPTITDPRLLAEWLREPSRYPLFAKPVGGKYSLSGVSADSFDDRRDEVVLLGGERRKVADLAAALIGGAGFLIQRRLAPAPDLAVRFGPRLWSARILVLVTPDDPVIHRAVAKIATGPTRPTITGAGATGSEQSTWRPEPSPARWKGQARSLWLMRPIRIPGSPSSARKSDAGTNSPTWFERRQKRLPVSERSPGTSRWLLADQPSLS